MAFIVPSSCVKTRSTLFKNKSRNTKAEPLFRIRDQRGVITASAGGWTREPDSPAALPWGGRESLEMDLRWITVLQGIILC